MINGVECNRFQHTAARRRLDQEKTLYSLGFMFQHTAARRRLGKSCKNCKNYHMGFNTQPPEGGWLC